MVPSGCELHLLACCMWYNNDRGMTMNDHALWARSLYGLDDWGCLARVLDKTTQPNPEPILVRASGTTKTTHRTLPSLLSLSIANVPVHHVG